MESGILGGGDLGFWIFVAALIVGGIWKETRLKAEKHETLRRIMEKTGTLDEAKLKELFDETAADEKKPGYVYRNLRIWGAVVMFMGAALALFFLLPTLVGHPIEWWYGGVGIGGSIALTGYGIFFSSRFAEPPAGTADAHKSL